MSDLTIRPIDARRPIDVNKFFTGMRRIHSEHLASLPPAERAAIEAREERLAKETHQPDPIGGE